MSRGPRRFRGTWQPDRTMRWWGRRTDGDGPVLDHVCAHQRNFDGDPVTRTVHQAQLFIHTRAALQSPRLTSSDGVHRFRGLPFLHCALCWAPTVSNLPLRDSLGGQADSVGVHVLPWRRRRADELCNDGCLCGQQSIRVPVNLPIMMTLVMSDLLPKRTHRKHRLQATIHRGEPTPARAPSIQPPRAASHHPASAS